MGKVIPITKLPAIPIIKPPVFTTREKINKPIKSCPLCRKVGMLGLKSCLYRREDTHPRLDHVQRWRENPSGEELVVFHPYDFSFFEIEQLVKFCKTRGLTFSVTGRSEYNPGHTSQITIRNLTKY